MWLPNRIFKAFRWQCLREIARIESFLNEHALLPPEKIANDILDELVIATNKLSHMRQKMTSEWQRTNEANEMENSRHKTPVWSIYHPVWSYLFLSGRFFWSIFRVNFSGHLLGSLVRVGSHRIRLIDLPWILYRRVPMGSRRFR